MLNQCSAAAAPNYHKPEGSGQQTFTLTIWRLRVWRLWEDHPWPPLVSGTLHGGTFLQLSLLLCCHTLSSFRVCLCLLFGKDTGCIGSRAHPNAIWPRSKLTNDIGKDATC